uniref:Major facilitator superfamily (MFS) profile domain-containing protein n=1 Tax=Alexandrium catenella TaxID=2925 RepID=A0A7S1LET4_ALECA|mmetsp:Transcript_112091/g.297920  ORF Transcript_112091/g.297920 Transcript_112091/m.297920 type:complete len:502 (+) Transcript_112091:92-1597(+)
MTSALPNLPGMEAKGRAPGALRPSEEGHRREVLKEVKKMAALRRKGPEMPAEEEREPSCLMTSLLCAVTMLEGMDTQLLPASMFALQRDIGFKLTDLAYLTVAQGVCINIAAPLWGILADRGILRRRTILAIGSFGQGVLSLGLALPTALWHMIALRALVGALLAALRPISNGVIADSTSEGRRGKIFGRVQSAHAVGMFVSTLLVGNLSRKTILSVSGWRVAFTIIGLASMIVSVFLACFLQEPVIVLKREDSSTSRQRRQKSTCSSILIEEVRDLCSFLTIPTFCVLVVQGIFGTLPWTIMGNMMLYFQLSGIDDGGYIADYLARKCGHNGRPLSAQITVAIGIPIVWLIFGGIQPTNGSFGLYFALIASFGVLGTWAQSGTNFPILTEIVPPRCRSRVMAWECALENSIANLLGPPVVTLLATEAFGYTFGHEAAAGKDPDSAIALGRAMQATICLPWCVTLAAYTLLHWSYPRDLRRLKLQESGATESKHQLRFQFE